LSASEREKHQTRTRSQKQALSPLSRFLAELRRSERAAQERNRKQTMPPSGGTAPLPLLLLPLLLPCYANAGSLEADVAALSDFRLAADRTGALASWDVSAYPAPCGGAWRGVTCAGGRVTRLVLEGLGLSGATALPALAPLDGLRVLSLKGNALSGAVPDLSPLAGLKLLFLARNALSGPVPPSLGKLYRLYRLDLSSNNLSGAVGGGVG
jgi:hypothetical protein